MTPEALGVPNRVHTTEKPSMTNWSFASSTNPTEAVVQPQTKKITEQKSLTRENGEKNQIIRFHITEKKVQITRQDN